MNSLNVPLKKIYTSSSPLLSTALLPIGPFALTQQPRVTE